MAPLKWDEWPRREGVTLNRTVDEHPLSHREPSSQPVAPSSKARSEYKEVMRADLNIPLSRVTSARVAEVDSSSEDEFQDSKEDPPPRSMAESITATRVPQVATFQTAQPQPDLTKHHIKPTGPVESPQTPSSVESAKTHHPTNLLEDIKYFHNATLSYQDAYEALQLQQAELQTKFTEQAQLVQEASEALKAVEAESTARQQEIATLRGQWEADIQQAIGQAVVQYQDQLSSAQANLQQRDQEHQQLIQKLQDQVCALELSLAGQATLPSIATSSNRTGLRQEVLNILPSTINQWRGAVQYESQDQAFLFQKQVRFEDNNSSPELGPVMNSGEGRPTLSLPVIPPRLSDISGILHTLHHSSTPIILFLEITRLTSSQLHL